MVSTKIWQILKKKSIEVSRVQVLKVQVLKVQALKVQINLKKEEEWNRKEINLQPNLSFLTIQHHKIMQTILNKMVWKE